MNTIMKGNYVALLTGTIDASVFNNVNNAITDVNERLRQYDYSIRKYIMDSVFDKIVFAENSGFDFDSEKYEELARKYSKDFEYVKCPSYVEETIEYGKGYGEITLINDAIRSSKILRSTDVVYKLTGRIFLRNSKNIVKTYNDHSNEFLVIENEKWCYTHIFKVAINDYFQVLQGAYEDMKKTRLNIEHTYYSRLRYADMDIGSFRVWPSFEGVMGENNHSYSCSWKGQLYHTLLCKLQCYRIGSKFSGLAHY